MATGNGNVEMMVSVLPGTMTGFAALNAGLASINNSFLNMTQAISDNFGMVDAAILSTGVVIAQVASDAVNAFADFEQSMKIVQMVSGQTADDISYLGQKANEFAIQYRVDIDSITEGLQTLGRAGLNSASEQTEVLQNGLNTAKLEGRELNSVLQELIQNTALLGGDLKSDQFGEQSEYVNNLMVATSLNAPINTHDISETLKYSGGIAAAAGANIESEQGKEVLTDYMAAIAAFARKGVSGSIAGTALRAFFNKPATQDSSVLEALATIKLKPEYLWEDDEQTMKPISEQIRIIQGQMDKLNVSTMDRLQLWSKIVGGKMGQQMMKLDATDIKDISSDIKEAEAAGSLANKSMQTFKATMNEIGQEGQRAFRNFGSTLVFFLNPVLKVLKEIVHIFDNPIATTALAAGLFGFFRAFVSRVRQVVSGFKQGLVNIWQDYASDNRLSIRQYRGEVDKYGNKIINGRVYSSNDTKSTSTSTTKQEPRLIDAKSPKDFMKQWKVSTSNQAWEDFKKGKLSADQFGFINKTSTWSESEMLEQMARKGMIPQYMYDDIRKGYTKKAFMGKYADEAGGTGEYEDLVDEYNRKLKKNGEVISDNSNKVSNNTKTIQERNAYMNKIQDASKENIVFRQHREIQNSEVKKNETILVNTRNTATAVIAEWERMCTALTQSLGLVYNRNTKMGADDQARMSAYMNQRVQQHEDYIRYKNTTLPGGSKPVLDTQKSLEDIAKRNRDLTNMYIADQDRMAIHMRYQYERYKNFTPSYPLTYEQKPENIFKSDEQIAKDIEKRNNSLSKMHDEDQQRMANFYKSKVNQSDAAQAAIKTSSLQGVTPATATMMAQEIIKLKEEELLIEQQIVATKRGGSQPSSKVPFPYVDPKQKEAFDSQAKTQKYLEDQARNASRSAHKTSRAPVPSTITTYEEYANKYLSEAYEDAKRNRMVNQRTNEQGYIDFYKQQNAALEERNAKLLEQNSKSFTQNPIMPPVSFRQNLKQSVSDTASSLKTSIRNFGSTFFGNLKGFLTKDRSGSAFAFANKGVGKLFNGMLNLSDLVGGPVMAAFMLIPIIIQQIENWHQAHVKKMQELGEKVDDAYKKIDAAESGLKSAYSSEYPDMDKKELEQVTLDVYSQMNEDMVNAINNGMDNWIEKMAPDSVTLPEYEENEEGDLKEKEQPEQDFTAAVNENTKALYQAIFELQQASSKYVTEATDDYWGTDGAFSVVTDSYGKLADVMTHASTMGSAFEDNNEFLLTASQKADDYDGNTELVGLLLEDFKDTNGEWIKGLRRAMGNNVDELAAVIQPSSREFLEQQAKFAYGIGAANNARLQLSMQKDKKSWQALAKEIAKEERKSGKALNKSASANSGNKRLEGLVAKLNASMGNNFSRTQILQAAYLQQLQDMYQVAQQVFTPLFQQAAQATTATWQSSLGINSATQNTVNTTGGTMDNVSIVAGLVAIIARSTAKTAFHDAYVNMDPNAPNVSASDKHLHELAMKNDTEGFYKAVMEEANTGQVQGGWLNGGAISSALNFVGLGKYVPQIGVDGQIDARYGAFQYGAFTESIAKQVAYGYNPQDAWAKAQKDAEEYKNEGRSIQDYLIDIDKNYQNPGFLEKIENAYEASGIGEPDDNGSGGGGGGSGSGDSDNKDKGTKKERVDLVLCNKKEIPKLNVNLFKKPPSFTVLNKNFKLRDIKVNTQDKPKAVLSSIKNAIIDVQKRSDPKIIQDESAEYDPVSATEGSSVPSGSTNTGTD